jgi:exo-1,4-beta-D-glucosaminidase
MVVPDINGTVLDDQVTGNISSPSQAVHNAVISPKVPATTAPPTPATTYFVELIMKQHGVAIDRNVYWHSTQKDLVDWRATIGNPQATMKQYADMQALQSLPRAMVTATASTQPPAGPGGNAVTRITITNTSTTPTVGFFLRADVRRGKVDGTVLPGDNEVLPITWSDNDITLWPGESETVTATYDPARLHGATPVVSVFGSNVPRFDVPAPETARPGVTSQPGAAFFGLGATATGGFGGSPLAAGVGAGWIQDPRRM